MKTQKIEVERLEAEQMERRVAPVTVTKPPCSMMLFLSGDL